MAVSVRKEITGSACTAFEVSSALEENRKVDAAGRREHRSRSIHARHVLAFETSLEHAHRRAGQHHGGLSALPANRQPSTASVNCDG